MNAILELPPTGRFEARPETVGTTEDELRDIAAGLAFPHRYKIVTENMQHAAAMLATRTAGHC